MPDVTHQAPVVALITNGHTVNQVQVHCPFCGGRHSHSWFDEADGLRSPTCGAVASYAVRVGTRERIDHMRAQFPDPDGVVSLAPLRFSYCYQRDGREDLVGVLMDTTAGGFCVWLPANSAVQLAAQLVEVVENVGVLRERYAERRFAESPSQP